MRKVLTTIALVLGPGAFGLTAHATGDGWTPWDTPAGGDRTASATSTVSCEAAIVTWEADVEASAAGSSVEHPNIDLEVPAGETVTVDYAMSDGAAPDGGSARLFIYYTPDADTWNQAPDQQAVADSTDGTLKILADGGTIGTIGVVYDTSGSNAGTVTFSNLQVAGESVQFCKPAPPPEVCEHDDSLDADDPKCKPDDGKDDEGEDEDKDKSKDEDESTDEPTSDDDTTPASTTETLPDTGVSLLWLVGGGIVLVLAGGGMALRRRTQ